jgi:hypothetical protein
VAELAIAVSSAGKKKKLLLFLTETVRWAGWLRLWAGLVLGYDGPTGKLLFFFSIFISCSKFVI